MSYFAGGNQDLAEDVSALGKHLQEFIVTDREKQCVDHGGWLFRNLQQLKSIRDIYIRHDASGSWLMLVGMPLLKAKTSKERQVWIEKFLKDYKAAIRDDLDGHFALVAYDATQRKLIMASDWNNFIPVYYTRSSKGFLFCSSELALAKLLQPDANPVGVAQTINLGCTWHLSRFEDISKMQPCEILIVDEKLRLHQDRYWHPMHEAGWKDRFDDILERWMALLQAGVAAFYETATDKTVTTNLTAGEDSRLLVAACQALGIPYEAIVSGFPDDADVIAARKIADEVGISLRVNPHRTIREDELLERAIPYALSDEGYGSFFRSSLSKTSPVQNEAGRISRLHFIGLPGGEAFRGNHYNRAKLIFSSRTGHFRPKPYARIKFLLDFYPGLFGDLSHTFLESFYAQVEQSVQEASSFPDGIQLDHLMRDFQTCNWSLSQRLPFYLPYGLKDLTRSIYTIPPHFKRGGRLTKACTELLFPELARMKTQHGVPTIRRTWARSPLFLPEHLSELKRVARGVAHRYLHVNQANKSLANKHNLNYHGETMKTLFNRDPYAQWFKSTDAMVSGRYYDPRVMDPVLSEAREGRCRYIHMLGRIVNHELACRYVYGALP